MQSEYFYRSVIYLCEHNKDGSLGFVLNKPTGLLLNDVFPHLKNAHFPVFEGGPVSTNQLFYTHTLGTQLADSIRVTNDVYWGGNFMALCSMIEKNQIQAHQIRFYIGYSGWGAEQLEDEILNDSWFHHAGNYKQLTTQLPDNVWGQEMIKISPSHKVFADYAFFPSLN